MTLDVGLQPALEVDETIRRQADAIFEKEQEYVVEAAHRKPKKDPTLYVNDDGFESSLCDYHSYLLTYHWKTRFLTQTRPNVANPEIYRMESPLTQTNSLGSLIAFGTQSTQRRPLRTISVGDVLESPVNNSLTRLRKRGSSPSIDDGEAHREHSPPKTQRNAFDLLGKKSQRTKENAKKVEKSEYVHAEAEESDDEDQFGFGGHRNKDDGEEEADGEDLDKTLEGLVDDAEMDDVTMAEDLVMEKVK